MEQQTTYNANSIAVLEGLEAVRKRPGMYIGSVSTRGLNHLIYEIVDNAVDEHLAGYCSNIQVILDEDGTATIQDNGRGIPTGINSKTGIPAVEMVFTMLHAGGKFGTGGYKISGGLHGVGASVVNALSVWLEVKVRSEGKVYQQMYEKGKAVAPLEVIGTCRKGDTGTTVTFLPDGKIVLELSAPLEEDIFCAKVKKGGELTSRKSIAIKDVTVPLPVLTETDKQNLKLLRKYHVTGVMLPFVRNADDLITLRKELCADGMDYIRIFAKIESLEGVENLPSLLPFCDEIVIARGDLGNAIPLPKLPAIQKQIAMTCLRAKKPFMVVTQMLASMEQNPVPTRAEVTDIFQAVLDGASSLMLTGETAVGAYPEEAIKILAQTSEEALRFKIAKF